MKKACIVCGNEIAYSKVEYAIKMNNISKYCSTICKEKNKYDEIPNGNCPIGYIYCLMIDKKPIYIGQTTNIKSRIKCHKQNIKNNNKLIYRFIRWYAENNPGYLFSIKILKCCPKYELDYYEKKYIKFCLNKGCKIKNDCIYSRHLKDYNI